MPKDSTLRVLRLPAVEEKSGLKRSRIHDLEAQGRFPRRIKLSDRASGWLEHEIDAWLAERMAAREGSSSENKISGA